MIHKFIDMFPEFQLLFFKGAFACFCRENSSKCFETTGILTSKYVAANLIEEIKFCDVTNHLFSKF